MMRNASLQFLPLAIATMFVAACGTDATVPEVPTVDVPAGPVKDNPYTLTGSGQSGATLEVRGGPEAVASTAIGANGRFSVSVALVSDSKNLLLVSQRNEAGNESLLTKVEIIHDGTPPAPPQVDPPATPTRVSAPLLRGSTEAGAIVRVAGGELAVSTEADASGRFAVEVPLKTSLSAPVENTLVVTAEDAAGNVSGELTVTIVFDANMPVAAPTLDLPPSPTNQDTVTLTGGADAEAGIVISGGPTPANGTADKDGRFAVEVELRKNAITTFSVFAVGNRSVSPSVSVAVVHDDVAPFPPALDPLPERTADTSITVSGQAEPGSTVFVTGGAQDTSGPVDASGDFSFEVNLAAEAENELALVVKDAAGNESEPLLVTVRQDETTPQPPKLDAIGSPTNQSTITVSGTAGDGVGIVVTGGALPASTTAAADGTFSVEVTLTSNAVNELQVLRDDTDAKTVVVVVHDDIAPSKPSLAALPSPTNRLTIAVAGTTEASARVVVTGGSATSSGHADGNGRFSVPVTLVTDQSNTLSVTAQDRAGNVSNASTATVVHSSDLGDAPVLDQPNPAPVRDVEWLLTGKVTQPTATTVVHVAGASQPASGEVDGQSGAFSIGVTLGANAANTLSVTSKNGDIESPAALVTVVHDDIAPDAAVSEKLQIGKGNNCNFLSPARGVTVSGTEGAVEAGATVRVTNTTRTTTTSTRADDTGAFSTSLTGCANDTLRFIVVDDAGNESEPIERKIN